MSQDIVFLIEKYNSEILFHKQAMKRWMLKDQVAYATATAKVVAYQRVVADLELVLQTN